MEHTKGIWAWQKFGDDYCLTAQHGMREIIISALTKTKSPSKKPAQVVMNDDGILRPVTPEHPNAKVIAAAPQLLEGCIDALKVLKREGLHGNLTDWLEAVIKKATA